MVMIDVYSYEKVEKLWVRSRLSSHGPRPCHVLQCHEILTDCIAL